MQSMLAAGAEAGSNWWFTFVDGWANSASVIGLLITAVGFIITWTIQRRMRAEIKKGLLKVAKQVIQQSLDQLRMKLMMVKENVAVLS